MTNICANGAQWSLQKLVNALLNRLFWTCDDDDDAIGDDDDDGGDGGGKECDDSQLSKERMLINSL